MAAASIVFKDNEEYSKKLIHSAIMIFKFSRQYRGRYSAGGVEAGWFYNSRSYWDEFTWSGAWLYYATGNSSYLKLVTTTGLGKQAGIFRGALDNSLLSWDNMPAGTAVSSSVFLLHLNLYKTNVIKFCALVCCPPWHSRCKPVILTCNSHLYVSAC